MLLWYTVEGLALPNQWTRLSPFTGVVSPCCVLRKKWYHRASEHIYHLVEQWLVLAVRTLEFCSHETSNNPPTVITQCVVSPRALVCHPDHSLVRGICLEGKWLARAQPPQTAVKKLPEMEKAGRCQCSTQTCSSGTFAVCNCYSFIKWNHSLASELVEHNSLRTNAA